MAVEILTVSLSDESIVALAERIAMLLDKGNRSVTQSNPPPAQNPQSAERSASQGPADPWQNSNNGGQQQNQGYQGQQGQQQGPGQNQGYQQTGSQGSFGQGQQQGQNCAHGPMQFVPAGTNRNTNEAYNAYYKCPLQRGTQGRCRNVYI